MKIANLVQTATESGRVSGAQSGAQNYQQKVLEFCVEAKTAKEIKEYLEIKSKRYVAEKIIKPLIDSGKLEYTNKNIVNAKNQKYITVKK